MRNSYPISGALKAAGMRFRSDFTSAALDMQNGMVIAGTPSYTASGLLYPGAASDRIYFDIRNKLLFNPPFTIVLEFTPGFTKDDSSDHRLFEMAGGSGGRFLFQKNASDQLVATVNDVTVFTVAYATWQASWNNSVKNTLVLTSQSGSTSLWINGTAVVTASATSYATQTDDWTLYLGSTNGGASQCTNTTFHRLEFYQGLATTADESVLRNGTLISDLSVENSLAILPLKKDYLGSDGVELLLDADCQALTTTRWPATADVTMSKVADSALGGLALRGTCTGGSGEGWGTQSIISDNTTYRFRGKWRCSGGTVTPYMWAGLTQMMTGIPAGTTEWAEFDVIGTSGAGVVIALFGARYMNEGDWFEVRDCSVQEVKRVTPVYGQAAKRILGPELLVDNDCETAGTAAWTEYEATASKNTTNPIAGTQALRITATAGAGTRYPSVLQTVLEVGKRYFANGYMRTDGTLTPYVTSFVSTWWAGAASTSWQYFEFEFTATQTYLEFLSSLSDPVGDEWIEIDNVSCREILCSGAQPLLGSDGETSAEFPTRVNKRNGGYSFDGGDVITLPDSNHYSFGDGATDVAYTFGIRLGNPNLAAQNGLLSKGVYGTTGEYFVRLETTGSVQWYNIDQSAATGYIRVITAALTWNEGDTLIGVYDGSSSETGMYLYQNSVDVGGVKADSSYTAMESLAAPVYVGHYNTAYLNGRLYDIFLYRNFRASPMQVKALHYMLKEMA